MLPQDMNLTLKPPSCLMIIALHRKMLPLLVMLLVLSGISLSAVGEASSHGFAELTGEAPPGHHDHSHSHDDSDGKSDEHSHHDSSNHSHESLDHPTIRPIADHWVSIRQSPSDPGDSPRSFRYRLERPPKAS